MRVKLAVCTQPYPGFSRRLRTSLRQIGLAAALALLLWSPVRAQFGYHEPGITVEGSGVTRAVPDVVEINIRLSARAELTDDAVVKHRDSRKRTLDTFKALKLDNLELEEKDLSLRPGNAQEVMQMMWNGMPPAQNRRTQIEVGSMLRARLKDVGKVPPEELMSTIGKLLDAAQDSGAGLGLSDADMMQMRYYGYGRQQSTLVKFIVTNINDTREKAYELAVADARQRAERLARLNGVKLGSVLAVDELGGGGQSNPYYYIPVDLDSKENPSEVMAETLSGAKISIRLRVRFAIDGSKTAQAAKSAPDEATPVAVQEKSR